MIIYYSLIKQLTGFGRNADINRWSALSRLLFFNSEKWLKKKKETFNIDLEISKLLFLKHLNHNINCVFKLLCWDKMIASNLKFLWSEL